MKEAPIAPRISLMHTLDVLAGTSDRYSSCLPTTSASKDRHIIRRTWRQFASVPLPVSLPNKGGWLPYGGADTPKIALLQAQDRIAVIPFCLLFSSSLYQLAVSSTYLSLPAIAYSGHIASSYSTLHVLLELTTAAITWRQRLTCHRSCLSSLLRQATKRLLALG